MARTKARTKRGSAQGVQMRNVSYGKPKRPDPATLAIHRLRAERDVRERGTDDCCPLYRARCVTRFVKLVLGEDEPTRLLTPKKLQGRPTRPLRGHQGHPARKTRAEKRWGWMHPNEQEKHLQEINRLMRDHMRDHPGDGLISGPLAVAAKYAIREWAESVWGLPGAEHAAALYTYLIDTWGIALHTFDRDAYLAWREDSRQRALAP